MTPPEAVLNSIRAFCKARFNFVLGDDEYALVDALAREYPRDPEFVVREAVAAIKERLEATVKSPPVSPVHVPAPAPVHDPVPYSIPEAIEERLNDHIAPGVTSTQVILVESRDRDLDKYPEPSEYVLDVPDIINVESITLESAVIPASQYLIHDGNDTFRVQETNAQESSNEWVDVNIPHGDYDITSLAAAIKAALDGAGAGATYAVTETSLTSTLAITSSLGGTADLFNLDFTSRDIAQVLGYRPQEYTGLLTYSAPWRYNLSGEPYVLLQVNDYDLVDSAGDTVRALAVIPLDGSRTIFRENGDYTATYIPPGISARINTLRVRITDRSGNLYDFNGVDHNFTLRVTTRNHS